MKKRGQIEITADILELCAHERNKTCIMYKTNLSYAQLMNYLEFLTSRNLLKQNARCYITTDKGIRFLTAFANLNNAIGQKTGTTIPCNIAMR